MFHDRHRFMELAAAEMSQYGSKAEETYQLGISMHNLFGSKFINRHKIGFYIIMDGNGTVKLLAL